MLTKMRSVTGLLESGATIATYLAPFWAGFSRGQDCSLDSDLEKALVVLPTLAKSGTEAVNGVIDNKLSPYSTKTKIGPFTYRREVVEEPRIKTRKRAALGAGMGLYQGTKATVVSYIIGYVIGAILK